MSDNKNSLLKELDVIYKEVRSKIQKASFLGKSVADKLGPVEDILLFVGKVVQKVEDLETQNKFLSDELARINLELARQNTLILHINGIDEAIEKLEK